jgi:HEPN domain-containing protein
MTLPSDLTEWISRAEEDYQLTVSALRRKKILIVGAVFHSQQCAEKYMKAILVLRGQSFPRTHDLVALADLCENNGSFLPIEADDLEKLSSFAVAVRYPGTLPTVEEAKEALEIARKVRKFGRKLIIQK